MLHLNIRMQKTSDVCEGEGLTVEEVIYFVVSFCPMSSCL